MESAGFVFALRSCDVTHRVPTHKNCVTLVMFKFRGNVWEHRKGLYYRNINAINSSIDKIKINTFLSEMLCIVVLKAANDEL